jgi:hypothetical protein
MKIQVIQTLPNGQVTQQVLSKEGSEVLKIQAQPGAKISFNVEGAKPADAANAKAKTGTIKKSGNNLVLESEGEALVEVTDFYSTAGASVGSVGWNYAATDATVMSATPEAQALSSDAAVSESGALFPAIAPGWLVAGGAATVAAVASGGSSSGVSAVVASTTTVVSGVITAGQLVTGHGLTVQFYKKDGVTLLGTPVSVDATGHFTATLSIAAGEAIIAKVIDASTGNDFKDEATNANKDLNAALMTVGVSNGGNLVLNINPLTTIAAQKAGLSADGTTGSVADAATATSANAAVAKAFGVADITTTTPDVTNDGAFDSTTAAGKIGAVLAAISGADLANGGNAQATIDALTLAVNTTTGTLTTAQQTVLAQGAAVAEAGSGVTGVVGALSSALAAQNGSTSVSINSITADNILNAAETTTDVVSGTTKITGTNATGATVVLTFGTHAMNGFVTPLVGGTTWEYVLTSADITNLGADGGQSVTATATLTGGATATATRVFVLNAVNDAPLIAASAVGLADTAAADTFTEQTGTLSAVDPDAGTTPTTLTYGITGGAAGATVSGVVYDVSKAGTYGTLYVKSTTGEYVFVANATAINHVSANTTETFAVTASDGSLSGTNNLIVTITGANDTPLLVTPTAIALTDTAAADIFANQTGTLSASDAEGTALTYGITGSSAGATVGGIAYEVSKVGAYGTLYVKATGEYVYVANAAAINALSAGVSNQPPTTETFAVTASDGSLTGASTLTVNLTGANDTPVVVAPTAIALVDTAAVDSFVNQTGTLSATDAEGTSLTYGITSSGAGGTVGGVVYDVSKAGTYGTLYVKSSTGEYVYVANATAINHLSANATDTFAVTASDGSLSGTNNLTVNITGVNDTPVLVAPTAIALVDTVAADTFANQTGMLSANDAEGTALTYGITGSGAGATVGGTTYDVSKVGTYGTLYVKSSTGEYVFVANAAAVNAVSANTTEAFTVTASDGVATGNNTLTINVTGANDRPVLASNFGVNPTPLAGDYDYVSLIIGQTVPSIVNASSVFTDVDTGHAAMTYSLLTVDGVPGGSIAGVTFHSDGTITGSPTAVVGTTYPTDYNVVFRAYDGNNSALYTDHTLIFHMLKAPVAQSISVADGTSSNTTSLGKAGETLDVSVVFSEVVDVVGSPTISLSINGHTVTATYSAGSGASDKTLHFSVAIPSGSIYDGNSISLIAVTPNVSGTSVIGHDSTQPWDATPMPAAYTSYTVDNTLPSAPVLAEYLTTHVADSYLNNSESTTTTFRATLPTSGSTAVAGDKIELLLGGASFGTAKIVTLTTANITSGYVDFAVLKADLGVDGAKSLTSRVTDLAGNVGTASAAVTFTLDTTPPAAVAALLEQGSTDLIDAYMNSAESTTTTFRATLPTTGSTAVAGDKIELLLGTASFSTAKTVTLSGINITNGYVDFTVLKAELGADGVKSLTSRITDIAGNVGAVNATALTFTLDVTAPTVISFSSTTANGSYKAGQTVNVTATMDSTVQTGATFVATMDTGETVTLTAGVAGTTLVGTYTIGANKTSADLTVSSYTPGTVLDVAGNAMTATVVPAGANNIAGSKAIVVDSVAPTVSNIPLTVNENSTAVGSLLANEAVTWAIGTGLDSALFSLTGANGLTWAAHNYEVDAHTYSVNVVATDGAGNQTTSAVTVNLANVNEAPTYTAAPGADTITLARAIASPTSSVTSHFTDPDLTGALGTPAITYTLASGSTLPPGVTLNSDGTFSVNTSTVAAAGTYYVSIIATDHGVTGDVTSLSSLAHAYTLNLVDAPALAAPQALDNLAGATALDVRSALVLGFNQNISLGTGHIYVKDDMGVAGWTHTNTNTAESIQDTTNNTVDITLLNGVVTSIFVGAVDRTSSLDLTSSVLINGANLVIDLKQKTSSGPGATLGATNLTASTSDLNHTAFDWDFGSNYHVEFDAGIVKSLASPTLTNSAMTNATTLNFTTVTPSESSSGASSKMMDSTGASTALTDGMLWVNGNQSNPVSGAAFVVDMSTGAKAIVMDTNGMNTRTSYLTSFTKLNSFGIDDLVYLDNHGVTGMITTDGLAVQNAANWTNVAGVSAYRNIQDIGSNASLGQLWFYSDAGVTPISTSIGDSGLEAALKFGSNPATNLVIFG